jgi:glucose/mannose transport system permease protein
MRRLSWERVTSILLLAPSTIAIIVFVYGFIGFTGYVSLSKWNNLLPDLTLVGLRNYAKLFANQRFQFDMRNTVVFTVLFLLGCLVIGFFLAWLIDQRIRAESIFRSIFLFPMAISFIVTGVVWRWLLNPGSPQMGATGVNLLFERMGLDFLNWGWFTDPTIWFIRPETAVGAFLTNAGLGALTKPSIGVAIAMFSVVVAATWQMSGYTMALYLAGLRAIPGDVREAALVDGANEWQVLRFITIPLLKPVTLSAVIILGHISLKIYDLVVAMTGPGPGFATDVPAYFMWDTTFRGNHFATGSAVAMVLLLLVALLIVPYLIHTNRTEADI